MIRSLDDLRGFAIGATDGSIGNVADAYLDDQDWALRYLVVDTRNWLPSRKVLISPFSILGIDWEESRVDVALFRKQIQKSPGIDADKPVSRQHETAFLRYYGYPRYWAGPYLWGTVAYPVVPIDERPEDAIDPGLELSPRGMIESAESHLQSAAAVAGYDIEAADGAPATGCRESMSSSCMNGSSM